MPINPYYVEPMSISEGFGTVLSGLQMRKQQQQQQALLSRGAEIMRTGTPEDLADFAMKNPELISVMDKAIGFRNEATKQNAIQAARDILIGGKPPAQALIERAEMVIGEGGDAAGTMQLAEQAQQDPQIAKAEAEKVLALYDPAAYKQYKISTTPEAIEEPKVGAQEILEDGTIIQSTAKGPVVYDPTGTKVTGQAAADAIKKARAEKVSNIRAAAGEKKRATLEAEEELKAKVEAGVVSAKEGAKASVNAYNRLEKINQNISNIDEAIRLIDAGAETGAITSLFPSIRAASVKLDNLQKRLGLDVVGSTTFGALSESELKFALDTALPLKLKGEELKSWLREKKTSQEKLADYVEAAAIFLGTPGNTPKDWIEKQREQRKEASVSGEKIPAEIGRIPIQQGKIKFLGFE